MKLVTGQDEIVADFVSAGLGRKIHPPYTAMGWVVVLDGNWRLVSGAVFNDYHGASIEISFYGRITRQMCRDIHDYVFKQLKCLRLTARTKFRSPAHKLLQDHGWAYEGVLKRFYGYERTEWAIMFRLDADVANRWVNGQRSVASSSLQQSGWNDTAAAAIQLTDCAATGGT